MDFDYAGPSNVPYIQTNQPPPREPHARSISVPYAKDCEACVRMALGCGDLLLDPQMKECQLMQRSVKSLLYPECTLQARLYSPFPESMVNEQCSDVCSVEEQLQYGEGYTRPYTA